MEAAVDLAYEATEPASGPVIVLLHGFPLSHAMWRHQVEALVAEGWRVIAPDLRCHGKSPRPDVSATLERHVADVARLVDTLGLDRFALGGNGLGAYVALAFAIESPGRVGALLLSGARAGPEPDERRAARYALAEDVKRRGVGILAHDSLPRLLTPRTLEHRAELTADVAWMMRGTSEVGAIHTLTGLATRPDQRARFHEVRAPTLILVGAEDNDTPLKSAQGLAQEIPRARLEVIPAAAHLAPMENPAAFNDAMLRWLRGLGPRT